MSTPSSVSSVKSEPTSSTTLDVDAVVVGYHSGTGSPEPAPGASDVDSAFPGGLAASLSLLGASGELEETRRVPSLGAISAPLVVAVGLGAPPGGGAVDAATLSRAAGAGVRACEGKGRVALALPAETLEQVGAAALGGVLGRYSFERYRTGEESPAGPAELLVACSLQDGDGAVERARVIGESVNLARDLVNTAPADLVPEDLAGIAEEVARENDLGIETLDERALAEGGYGGLVGVGQGSANPPRLVRLSYAPQNPGPAAPTLAFVGKGITFDSGGLSLKPAQSMEWMKSDMAGAAAVLAAMRAIAELRPPVNVVAYLAIAENMPGGAAQRPSDVVTIYGGTTVEVMNTDAEGRLVMADAIVRAHEDEPDLIVDVATLTGAQLVALGTRVFGVMGNSDQLRDGVVAAASAAGETAWPMPLPEELRKGLDSTVADIANVASERWGGMLTAGVFLQEFIADGMRWAHLDIAGPSFNQGEPFGHTPRGATGAATRTLVRLAEEHAEHPRRTE